MAKFPVIFNQRNWEESSKFVERNGRHVRSIKILCEIDNVREVGNILKNTPNIELFVCDNAMIQNVESIENIGEENIPKNLKNLKTLEINSRFKTVKKLIEIFKAATCLKKIMVSVVLYEPQLHLADFLMHQEHLESLRISGVSGSEDTHLDSIFTDKFMESYKFKLRTLVVDCNLFYKENFYRFLLDQSGNLKELTMEAYNMDFKYFRVVLNHFHSLEKLSFSVKTLLNDRRVEEIKNLRLPNLRDLELTGFCEDVSVSVSLAEHFPNLESLNMHVAYFSMHNILEKLPKLKKLTSHCVKMEMLLLAESVSIVELNLFNIHSTLDSIYWRKLAENFPNLERFVIKNIDMGNLIATLNKDVANILDNLKLFQNLKYFEINNSEQGWIAVNEDADLLGPEIEETDAKFKLIMKNSELSITNYFKTVQAEAIEKLISDLAIIKVHEI